MTTPTQNRRLISINLIEKVRGYRNIVILQSVLILAAVLLKDIFSTIGIDKHISHILRDTLFLPIAATYLFVIWNMLSKFTKRKYLFGILILFIVLLMLITANPFYDFFSVESAKRPFFFIIHLSIFIIEAIVIYYAILDIFTGHRMSQEKLWGSASIFLMIGICFGSLYDVLNIIDLGCMGVPLQLGLESYTASIAYSMTIIGGHESYPNAIPLIANLGVVEAVISNLFVVLLVGRLLGKPEEEDGEQNN